MQQLITPDFAELNGLNEICKRLSSTPDGLTIVRASDLYLSDVISDINEWNEQLDKIVKQVQTYIRNS